MHAAGIYAEAIASSQVNATGDSMEVSFSLNNRDSLPVLGAEVTCLGQNFFFAKLEPNETAVIRGKVLLKQQDITQPYWLKMPKETGSYVIDDLVNVGKPENDPLAATFTVRMPEGSISNRIPILYKYTDPVKAEQYQPIEINGPVSVNVSPSLLIFNTAKPAEKKLVTYTVKANTAIDGALKVYSKLDGRPVLVLDTIVHLGKSEAFSVSRMTAAGAGSSATLGAEVILGNSSAKYSSAQKRISYDHIPDIYYQYADTANLLKMDLKIAGTKAGYIVGAGDKVPQAMTQMGYAVTYLNAEDILPATLAKFDVIVTGVQCL